MTFVRRSREEAWLDELLVLASKAGIRGNGNGTLLKNSRCVVDVVYLYVYARVPSGRLVYSLRDMIDNDPAP